MGRRFFPLTPPLSSPEAAEPQPQYTDEFRRRLGEQSETLRAEKRELLMSGGDPERVAAIDAELLDLRRQLRDGPQLVAGDCLSDRYQLLERLGGGGFGTVWKAFDEESQQVVAVKVLHGQHTDSRERLERFKRGATAMQRLAHPHIVRILEPYSEDAGYHYFVMEHLAGGTFLAAVETNRLDQPQRLQLIGQIATALEFAHSQGAIHRDVSPDNILLDAAGQTAKLTDFDLVRVADSTGGTRTGSLGKFIYAAPETLETGHAVDERCDVFSLGMTTVFALYGRRLPHKAFTRCEQFIDSLNVESSLATALKHAVEHERDDRLNSVSEFRQHLEHLPNEIPPTTKKSSGRKMPKRASSRTPADDIEWIRIPAGTFWMGAQSTDRTKRNYDLDARDVESPVHEVRLAPFEMASFPVTVAQFEQFITAGGYRVESLWAAGGFGNETSPEDWEQQKQFPDRPVVGVNWFEANACANWLGARLPTEAEWEFAARGDAGRRYPWGDAPPNDRRLNFSGNVGHVTPENSYSPGKTPAGVEDLAGNVWEWCADWFGSYSRQTVENPRGPENGEVRVLRGGSWYFEARYCRCSCRDGFLPRYRHVSVGFRVVRGS